MIELVFPEPHGSEFDLGLAPGGRVKLVKSASVDLASSPACVSIQVHCLQFHPQDTNHIFVGSNTVSYSACNRVLESIIMVHGISVGSGY